MEKFNVDIRLYLIMALGSNVLLHPQIDTVYKEDEINYYRAYKESNYFNCPMFSMFTTSKEERIKKVAGIVQYDYNHNIDHHLLYLIKKGFKPAWNYVKDINHVDINAFTQSWVNRRGGIDNVSEIDMFNISIVVIYLSVKAGKPYSLTSTYGEAIDNFFKESQLNCYWDKINFNDETINRYRKEIDELYKRFHIPKKNNQLLDSILDNINVAEIKKMPEPMLSKKTYEFFELRDMSFKRGISRYIGALSGWLKVLGINEMDLTANMKLNIRDIDKIFLEYLLAQKENAIPDENAELFVISTILIQALVNEYKKTKDIYLDDLKENFYYDLNRLQGFLKIKEEELRQKESALISDKNKLQAENHTLHEVLNSLQKEVIQLQSQLNAKENDKKELLALREYVFSLHSQNEFLEEIDNDTYQDVLNFLQPRKCAIVGGNPNWVKKIKTILPLFVFIETDNRNKDFRFLDNLEAVFFNTDHNSHSLYEKVMERMRKNSTPMFYITNTTNLKESILFIKNQLMHL